MNKFEKKNSQGSVFGLFMALLKVAQNLNATAGQEFFCIKMLKTDPKKVPSQKYVFAGSSWDNDLTFYEKKIPTSQSL